jgi:Flp pilus assembly protein TadD
MHASLVRYLCVMVPLFNLPAKDHISSRKGRAAIIVVLVCLLLPSGYSQSSREAQAQALLKQGRTEEALAILLDLHRSEPSNADLCEQIGIAYTQLENFPEAERFYREALRLNPQFLAARKNLGTVLWFLDRKNESEREFLAVTKARPADPVPHLYLGLAAHALQQFSRAREEFDKAGALASDNPEVLPAVVESHLATGDAGFPEKALARLSPTEDTDPALLSHLGALFQQYGDYAHAAAVLEKLVAAHKDSAETWRMLAGAYDHQGKSDRAYSCYSRALEFDPKSEDSYTALAEFASAHGNNEYALKVVARGLERLPGSSVLLFEQGVLSALEGDRSRAENSFVEASRLKPEWPLPLLALGVSQLESGDAVKAALTFGKARAKDPRDFRAHYLYASALSREGNASSRAVREEAVAALRTAIELNPRDARSHTLLGQIELAAGRADLAAAEWERALRIDPENATALYQLGLLCKKQGKTGEAERLLETFQRVKAKKHAEEGSLVEILRVVPERRAP